ncbi:tetratricopeptide repeat protein [Patescibacteria group bacterium]|nr:tetratricopeptide repeat protein [Patescibacteria group bacterium]
MFDILPIIVIIISVIIILIIIIRKFPALAILDLESIPEEKEAKFKKQIRKQLFDRALGRYGAGIVRYWLNIGKKINDFFLNLISNLNKKKRSYLSHKRISFEKKEKKSKKLLNEIDDYLNQENYEKAEEKAILILEFDKHNKLAYEKLANIYFLQKKYDEAREIYSFLVKLVAEKEDEVAQAEIYFTMADISKRNNNPSQAKEDLYHALEFDGKNPRFLDKLVELNIEFRDKESAVDAFSRLFEVNPDNKKLSKYKEEIENL